MMHSYFDVFDLMICKPDNVLILVLMDDALVPTISGNKKEVETGLNPCFNG